MRADALPVQDAAASLPGGFTPRAFATRLDDLAVPVEPKRPVESTDRILAACLVDADGGAPEVAELHRWTVARRLAALAAVRVAGHGGSERFALRCGAAGCGEAYEAEIDLRSRIGDDAATVEFVAGDRRHRARVPTGGDQARWQAERTPLHLVVASLLETPAPADRDLVAALDEALARSDPGRELELDLACPSCGRSQRHTIDLESHLLAGFAHEQRRRLRQIARLATAFHWSEAEIASMPAWRRDFYLAGIDTQQERGGYG